MGNQGYPRRGNFSVKMLPAAMRLFWLPILKLAYSSRLSWDRDAYLEANPDVASALLENRISSSWAHFACNGVFEGRKWWSDSRVPRFQGSGSSRYCLDPWAYLEISASGRVRPCCNYHDLEDLTSGDPAASSVRDAESFVRLRESLLHGDLSHRCRTCHIRSALPPEQLQAVIRTALHRPIGDIAKAGPLRSVRVDINERCNLRCIYCASSQPGYSGVEMSEEVFTCCERFISVQEGRITIVLNGHGETTFHPRWVEYFDRLARFGHRMALVSNFAKRYDNAELDALARFDLIEVSLDSANEDLMRRIRRHVSVSTITRNIEAVRTQAARLGIREPKISFSTGIYHPVVWELEEFADFAAALKARSVTFWNLRQYKPPEGASIEVTSLNRLEASRKIKAKAVLRRLREKLSASGIPFVFFGDFHDESGTPLL